MLKNIKEVFQVKFNCKEDIVRAKELKKGSKDPLEIELMSFIKSKCVNSQFTTNEEIYTDGYWFIIDMMESEGLDPEDDEEFCEYCKGKGLKFNKDGALNYRSLISFMEKECELMHFYI